jgi:hypothetical protein
MNYFKSIFLTLFIFAISFAKAQSIEGYVLDEDSNPIPFAKVWVKNYNNIYGVSDVNGYYKINLDNPGNYQIVFSFVGYENQNFDVIIKDIETARQDVYLKEKLNELDEVEVKVKKKNVGYEIVRHVIAHKDELASQARTYSVDVYIKGSETFDLKEKKRKSKNDNDEDDDPGKSTFEKEEDVEKENQNGARLNLLETYITVNFEYPNKLKEIKTAQSKLGNPQQIYLKHSPITADAYFNFYEGLLFKDRLHETPIVSPLHSSGILSYKYRLKKIITEGQDTIYKVHVSPRSVGTTTLEGDLYIKKHEWVLTKIDLSMHKGNLRQYDDFRIIQEYEKTDSVWLVTKQTFIYETKYGKETVKGQTDVVYSNYNLSPNFPEKYFNNEVGITKDDAYKKDSTYWQKIRPVKLTKEEQRKKFVQDSIKVAHTKKEYLDSIDAVYNKVTWEKVLWFGVTKRNRSKKTEWFLPSLPELIKPVSIAGPRVGLPLFYRKKFENNQWIIASSEITIGVLNKDFRGNIGLRHMYNPKRFSTYYLYYEHGLDIINGYVPIVEYLSPSNYFLADKFVASHRFEIANGLFLRTGVDMGRRSSISDLNFYNWKGDALQTQPPIQFDPYNVLRSTIALSYTPSQKYLIEPNKKIILGSRWPTFTLEHFKGWNILGSNIDFDRITFKVYQTFNIGTLGKSEYYINTGKYVNKDSVYFIDQKFFKSGDVVGITKYFMSNPQFSFQNLAQSYNTRDLYFEFHYFHNFNGAIINKIPFMKKTGIRLAAGGGMLFIPEYNNLYYQEAYAGLQRRFKFFRQRIKVGTFVVLSNSNYQPTKVQFKFRVDFESPEDVMFNF